MREVRIRIRPGLHDNEAELRTLTRRLNRAGVTHYRTQAGLSASHRLFRVRHLGSQRPGDV